MIKSNNIFLRKGYGEGKMNKKEKKQEIRYFCIASAALMFFAAFMFDSPSEIMQGMKKIILARGVLVTDYFELAGYGAGFFNAACMMVIAMVCISGVKLPYTGLTVAAVFCSAGFGFWGKNPVNVAPIILGTWIYAKVHQANFARYVYTAVFAACLAPFVTEFAYVLPFSPILNVIMAGILGMVIGFVIPPLAVHTSTMHMGYSLFNVGFAGGTLGFIIYSIMKSLGVQCQTVMIWKEGVHPWVSMGLLIYFVGTFLVGMFIEELNYIGFYKITRHSGRAVADFIMMDGRGNTLMNMGVMGLAAELYILCIGGDLSGPMVGSILTLFGFSAFGAHIKNYLPVLTGVVLAVLFMTPELTDVGMQIAAIFVVGVAPIAGEFGVLAGIISGMLHVAIVMSTSQMYAGLNLYNNGFSTGWVAIFMIPFLESFMRRFGRKNRVR